MNIEAKRQEVLTILYLFSGEDRDSENMLLLLKHLDSLDVMLVDKEAGPFMYSRQKTYPLMEGKDE